MWQLTRAFLANTAHAALYVGTATPPADPTREYAVGAGAPGYLNSTSVEREYVTPFGMVNTVAEYVARREFILEKSYANATAEGTRQYMDDEFINEE